MEKSKQKLEEEREKSRSFVRTSQNEIHAMKAAHDRAEKAAEAKRKEDRERMAAVQAEAKKSRDEIMVTLRENEARFVATNQILKSTEKVIKLSYTK